MTNRDSKSKDHQKTKDQAALVARLTEGDLKVIDRQLLDNASREWCKVSRIVLTTMIERGDGVTGLPESFYRERVTGLITAGFLDARGDLSDMHLSEVRLAQKS